MPGMLQVLFAVSGCAALIYQVVWFQLLSFAIGASALSLGVLLPTYLGGLCIGSLLLPRYVSRKAHPLRVFGALELAIGALGVAALYLIPALGGLYSALGRNGRGESCAATARRRAGLVARDDPDGRDAARRGAVDGSRRGRRGAARPPLRGERRGGSRRLRARGLLPAPRHDAYVATYVAVALDVAVGLTSFVLAAAKTTPQAATSTSTATMSGGGRTAPPAATSTMTDARATANRAWPILVAAALSGMTALSAEILWTRNLSLLFGGTVYAFALILAVFLLGLGAGSAAGVALGRRIDRAARSRGASSRCAPAIAWGAFAIARALPYWPLDVTLPATASAHARSSTAAHGTRGLARRVALGRELSARARGIDSRARVGRAATRGAPWARSTRRTRPARSSARLRRASCWFRCSAAPARAAGHLIAASLRRRSAILLVATRPARGATGDARRAHRGGSTHESWVAMCRFGDRRRARARMVRRSAAARARRLRPVPADARSRMRTSFTSARASPRRSRSRASRAGSSRITTPARRRLRTYPQDMRLQRMLGHLATLIPDHPLGARDRPRRRNHRGRRGASTPRWSDVVDRGDRAARGEGREGLLRGAESWCRHDPKVEIRVDDGRHVLATTREKFDAITSDPLDPWVKGAAALYTREFWELCKSRLSDDGVVTAFVQLYETTEDAAKSEIATFFSAFPHGALFVNTVNGRGYDAVLVGPRERRADRRRSHRCSGSPNRATSASRARCARSDSTRRSTSSALTRAAQPTCPAGSARPRSIPIAASGSNTSRPTA